jgi:hypothetical protein
MAAAVDGLFSTTEEPGVKGMMLRMMMVGAAWIATAEAQDAEDIRGPKPLVEIPQPPPPTPWLTYALIAAGVLLAVALLVWWLLRKKPVVLTPEQRARKELDQLRGEGGAMPPDLFAEAASGVLRRFIERRFGVAAPRRTTEEFLQEVMTGAHGLEERIDALRGFLRACDLAKFAGEDLDKLQREDLLVKARGFVNEPVKREEVAA